MSIEVIEEGVEDKVDWIPLDPESPDYEEPPEGRVLMFWWDDINEAMFGYVIQDEVIIFNVDEETLEENEMELNVTHWAYAERLIDVE